MDDPELGSPDEVSNSVAAYAETPLLTNESVRSSYACDGTTSKGAASVAEATEEREAARSYRDTVSAQARDSTSTRLLQTKIC